MKRFNGPNSRSILGAAVVLTTVLAQLCETTKAQTRRPSRGVRRSAKGPSRTSQPRSTPVRPLRRKTKQKAAGKPKRAGGKSPGFVIRKLGVVKGNVTRKKVQQLIQSRLKTTASLPHWDNAPSGASNNGSAIKISYPFTLTPARMHRRGLGSLGGNSGYGPAKLEASSIQTHGVPKMRMHAVSLHLHMRAGNTYIIDLDVVNSYAHGTLKVTLENGPESYSPQVIHSVEMNNVLRTHVLFAVQATEHGRKAFSFSFYRGANGMTPKTFELYSCKVDKLNTNPVP